MLGRLPPATVNDPFTKDGTPPNFSECVVPVSVQLVAHVAEPPTGKVSEDEPDCAIVLLHVSLRTTEVPPVKLQVDPLSSPEGPVSLIVPPETVTAPEPLNCPESLTVPPLIWLVV